MAEIGIPPEVESLLEQVLAGKDDEYKIKVLNIVVACGITPDDPLFLVLVAISALELLLEDAPVMVRQQLLDWQEQIEQVQSQVKKTAIEQQKAEITKTARELIKQQNQLKAQQFFTSIVPAMAVLLGAVAVGILLGITLPSFFAEKPDPTGPRQLTLAQAQALSWATSKEGQLARNIMNWNAGWLDTGQCEKDAQQLGVKMTLNNRTATSGFCIIWNQPPQKRQFE